MYVYLIDKCDIYYWKESLPFSPHNLFDLVFFAHLFILSLYRLCYEWFKLSNVLTAPNPH